MSLMRFHFEVFILVVFLLICLILFCYFRLLFLLSKLERLVKDYHRSYDSLFNQFESDLKAIKQDLGEWPSS